jgi:hypothetical protein
MSESTNRRIHPLAILGAILFALIILGLAYWAFRRAANGAPNQTEEPVYNMTIFPAPTQTPTVFVPTQLPTPTSEAPDILPEDAIGVGSFVKVVGTKGLGLNIRAAAGRGQNINFLAMDAEMFEVIDGPEVVDDLIWWKLEAPYDASRWGWAAEDYLERIKQETSTP